LAALAVMPALLEALQLDMAGAAVVAAATQEPMALPVEMVLLGSSSLRSFCKDETLGFN
jgi:hypothetical protein